MASIQAEVDNIAKRPVTDWGRLILEGSRQKEMSNSNDTRGIGAARLLRCLAAGGGDLVQSYHYAKAQYGDSNVATTTIRKALAAGDMTAGGFAIPQQLSSEVIDLLRPISAIRAMGPPVVRPNRGSIEFPKITTGASAAYIEENTDIPISEPVFGQVALVARKLVGMVPISNDLLRFSPDTAEQAIRNDLVEAIAKTEDANLIRGDGTQSKPKGLRFLAADANILTSNGGTAADIEDDFTDALNALDSKDVRLRNAWWLLHPSRKNHLLNLRDANGNLIYPEIRTRQPTIHGWPIITTTNIPADLGGGNDESEIYFVEANELLFGEVEGLLVDVSNEGSYVNTDATLVSSFQRDQTLLRVILRHDINVRHPEGIAVVTGVQWGA